MAQPDLENFAYLLAQNALQKNASLQTQLYDCDKGTDQYCWDTLNDTSACCFRLDLRNIPDDMTDAEETALTYLAAANYPIHEGYVQHKCMYGNVWSSIDKLQKEQETGTSLKILKADSVMKYIAYCEQAVVRALGFLSGILMVVYFN